MSESLPVVWNPFFLNQIMDSMAEGVFTMDTQGKITSWNKAMERISGYTAEETKGKTCRFIDFNSCFGKRCPSSMQECGILEHEESGVKECVLRHRNGFDVPIIKQARVVKDEHDRIIGVVETITDLTELEKARRKAEEAENRLAEYFKLDNLIGKSQKMLEVFAAVRAAAESNATVLIEGESGTGKELIANAIHYNSPHADQPYVTVNCSALPENLLETELFGHVKGAFTGALRDRKGRFEEADGGTIFLDEVGELSQYMQIKLLRVLQEREIERVGENKKRKLNLRIIAATHCSLKEKLREGSFREDLYYRLKVFPISVPPLRERKEDIPLLINHFIEKQNEKTGKGIQAVGPSAMRLIMEYSWPGNVRELENAIEHAFVLCSQDTITIDDLPLEMRTPLQSEQSSTARRQPAPQETAGRNGAWTRESLLQALRDCNWNKAEVARRMGVSRTAVWKYMKKWDIPLQNK